MHETTDVTSVDQLEAKHSREFDEQVEGLSPPDNCYYLTCAAYTVPE